MNPRLAAVGKPPTVDGFAALVAQNQWVTAEVFSSRQEALSWLATWPSTTVEGCRFDGTGGTQR
jgi:hypothetical protein